MKLPDQFVKTVKFGRKAMSPNQQTQISDLFPLGTILYLLRNRNICREA